MSRLRTVKNSNRLREHTDLRPVLRCKTRWSGTYDMVARFLEIKDYIKKIIDYDEFLEDLFVSLKKQEWITLEELFTKMQKLNSVMLKLQEENVTLLTVRKLFDYTLKSFPTMETYLSPSAHIVHSPAFESAIVKLLKKVLLLFPIFNINYFS